MLGVSSPMRVTQEELDGLSRYYPVRGICLEIQFYFHTGALSWLIKIPNPLSILRNKNSHSQTRDGMIESLRVLKTCRKTARSARRVAFQIIHSNIISAPDELR